MKIKNVMTGAALVVALGAGNANATIVGGNLSPYEWNLGTLNDGVHKTDTVMHVLVLPPTNTVIDHHNFSIGTDMGSAVVHAAFDVLDSTGTLKYWDIDNFNVSLEKLTSGIWGQIDTVGSGENPFSWASDPLLAGSYRFAVSGSYLGLLPTLIASGQYEYDVYATAAPTPAIPEPGEWALMLSGLGLMGYIVRRRQNRAA